MREEKREKGEREGETGLLGTGAEEERERQRERQGETEWEENK